MFPDVTVTVSCRKATASAPLSALKAAFQAFSRVRGALDKDKATDAEIATAILVQTLQHGIPADDTFKVPGSEAGDFLRMIGGRLDGKTEDIKQEDAMDEGMNSLRVRVTSHLNGLTVAEAEVTA